jgi:LmbE family N-acetylglucosaminyl deacetylase
MKMRFNSPNSDIFIPDSAPEKDALQRTTHLCLGAHQDDIEIMAFHGILECFGQKDKWFTGVTATDGGGSARDGLYHEYTDKTMKEIRLKEQRKAAYIGEYSAQIQLGYKSSEVKDPSLRSLSDDILKIIEIARPEFIYIHNPADKHPTHIAVMLRVIEALRMLPAKLHPKQVIGCETWRDLDWLPDSRKIALPVSKHPNLAASLLGVFDSQIAGGKRYDLGTLGRRSAHATYYQSHSIDTETALIFAMDLTTLLDKNLPVKKFTSDLIDSFKAEVNQNLDELS